MNNDIGGRVHKLEIGQKQIVGAVKKTITSVKHIESDVEEVKKKTMQNEINNRRTAEIAQETHTFLLEASSELKGAWKVIKWAVLPLLGIILPFLWAFINKWVAG